MAEITYKSGRIAFKTDHVSLSFTLREMMTRPLIPTTNLALDRIITIDSVDFSSKNILATSFEGSSVCDCDFTDCNMNHVNLKDSSFTNCNFTRATMMDADISGCTFDSCKLYDTVFDGVRINDHTGFINSKYVFDGFVPVSLIIDRGGFRAYVVDSNICVHYQRYFGPKRAQIIKYIGNIFV